MTATALRHEVEGATPVAEARATPSLIRSGWPHDAVIARHYGPNVDFLATPFTYDDLGARIVAEELGDWLDQLATVASNAVSTLSGPDAVRMAATADRWSDAAHELHLIAFGEDAEAENYTMRCMDAQEAADDGMRMVTVIPMNT